MSEMTLQAELPWSISREEDRRFRWILAQTLAASLLVGGIIPSMRIPTPAVDIEQELPPRRVRLLSQSPLPLPRPVPSIQETPVPPETRPLPAKAQAQATEAVTTRQAVARRGVLAMGDVLSELRARSPQEGVDARGNIADGPAEEAVRQTSILTADLTRGSGGIEDGVAPRSVLGTAGLPQRQDAATGSGDQTGGPRTGNSRSTALPGPLRSQEEIQEVLDRNKGAMYTLYNRALRENPGLQGKLVMSITIAPAGNVTRCVILSSELAAQSLERQLVALVTAIDFGDRPGVPVVTTKIPIEFFPR